LKITPERSGVINFKDELLDRNLCARCGLASESASLYLAESNYAILSGVNGKVTAHECAWASNLSRTGLTDQDFTSTNGLTTETFDAQSGTGVVVDVLRRTTSFDV